MRLKFIFLLLGSLLLCLSASFSHAQQSPFRVVAPKAFLELKAGETKSVTLDLQIPPQYFVYQDKTELKFLNLEGIFVKKISYPPTKVRSDPFFKKKLNVFEGLSPIEVSFQVPKEAEAGKRTLEALLKLQGCSDVLCYPEENHLIVFNLNVLGNPGTNVPTSQRTNVPTYQRTNVRFPWQNLLHTPDFNQVIAQGWWIVLAIIFIGGFLTSLTPCVLPIIPVTLMIIGVRAESPIRRNLILSTSLVLGLALTYALLGVLAVALGKSLGFVFQQRWVVIFLAALFFVLSLSMFGLFEIHLPFAIRQRLNQIKGHGVMGAFVSGGVSGVLAAPCAGPVVGSLLIFVATTQNYFQGFWFLFVYALGMGLLFIVLGTGYATFQARFGSLKVNLWIKRFLGVLLLLGSLFYLNTVIPIEKGFSYLFFKQPERVGWLNSDLLGLEVAKRENKVILIDFYAQWCAPCKELELGFFRRPEVVEVLEQMIPVRIDATFADDPQVQEILKKYQVVGWPTILFVSPDGKILKDLTVVSYNPELLLENMKKASLRASEAMIK